MRPAPRAFTSWSQTPPALRVGFSLLELILVLVVLGITTSVVAVRLSSMRTSQSVAQAARALEDQFGRCRHLAVSRGDLARLRLDLDAQTATVQVRTPAGFADPADAELPDCDLRSGVEAQTIAFAPGDPAQPATAGSAGNQAQMQTAGQVDILFYPDARCEPSGRVTFQKGVNVATVVCPPAGRPAYVEGAP